MYRGNIPLPPSIEQLYRLVYRHLCATTLPATLLIKPWGPYLSWAKRALLIVKNYLRVLERDHHVGGFGVTVAGELQRNRYFVGSWSGKLWPYVDVRVRHVATWQLDDFDAPVQVQCHKMARCLPCLVPHKGVGLERAWIAILHVIPQVFSPLKQKRAEHDQHDGNTHANADENQPIHSLLAMQQGNDRI